jgi:hypothetical protein
VRCEIDERDLFDGVTVFADLGREILYEGSVKRFAGVVRRRSPLSMAT